MLLYLWSFPFFVIHRVVGVATLDRDGIVLAEPPAKVDAPATVAAKG